MSEPARRAAALLAAAATVAVIVGLSRAPWPLPADHALLRLSWSGRPERIERCRELSDAELEKQPAHMRQRVECEGRSARYLVRVSHGGSLLSSDTVTGGGLRGDRAIHMLREYHLAPGTQPVAVGVRRQRRKNRRSRKPRSRTPPSRRWTAPDGNGRSGGGSGWSGSPRCSDWIRRSGWRRERSSW
jgi:hypothetical protein